VQNKINYPSDKQALIVRSIISRHHLDYVNDYVAT